MINGEKKNIPIISSIFSVKEHESNVLLPSYLLTQQERQNGSFGSSYYLNRIDLKTILYMTMESFDQLIKPYQRNSAHFEIVLERDKGESVPLDDILYPSGILQRIQEEQEIIKQLNQIAEEAGLEKFQIHSFAGEYQESLFYRRRRDSSAFGSCSCKCSLAGSAVYYPSERRRKSKKKTKRICSAAKYWNDTPKNHKNDFSGTFYLLICRNYNWNSFKSLFLIRAVQ